MSQPIQWGFKPDGIMVERGDLLRWKKAPTLAYTLTSITFDGVKVDYWSGQETFPYKELSEGCEYSKDGGLTWFSCNKLMAPSPLPSTCTVQSKSYSKESRVEPKQPILLLLLSWPFCFLLSVLFVTVTVLLAIPGYLLSLLEPRFRKVMQ